jgi:hypothetical protein
MVQIFANAASMLAFALKLKVAASAHMDNRVILGNFIMVFTFWFYSTAR